MTNLIDSKSNQRLGAPDQSLPHLHLVVEARLIPRFLKLIERGCMIQIKTGITIRQLLSQHLGISDNYIDNRIQTIFLDGKPVDDLDTAIVENGSKLALSAAMPGLVGITLRKGGFYASLRSTISYTKHPISDTKNAGEIILKLFNMVAKELGPELLAKGIRIEGNTFHQVMLRNAEDLKATSTSIHLNDEIIELSGLLEINWKGKEAFIQVVSKKNAGRKPIHKSP